MSHNGDSIDFGYHWRDGWYFRRLEDGSVQAAYAPYSAAPFPWDSAHLTITIPPNEWASIVASVSATGENGETWRKALAFHGGSS